MKETKESWSGISQFCKEMKWIPRSSWGYGARALGWAGRGGWVLKGRFPPQESWAHGRAEPPAVGSQAARWPEGPWTT